MYDQAAMDWVYRGTQPTREYRHCTDIQSWYLIGCDKGDARIDFDKKMIEGLVKMPELLKNDPLALKRIMDPIVSEGVWDEVNRRRSQGDISWAALFLLNSVTNSTLVAAGYKYSVFSPDPQIRAALKKAETELFEAALREPSIYSPAQLEFLKLSLEMFQTEPVTPSNLKVVLERL